MSGMVIAQVAETVPERVTRLVFLCAYLPANGQSLFDLIAANRDTGVAAPIEQAMLLSKDKRTCTVDAAHIRPLFYNRCPREAADRVPASFPVQGTLPLSGKVTLSPERFGGVPKAYISCLDDRVIPVRHQRHMLKLQACDELIQLDADHSPFLSCPETLAAVLHSVAAGET
jgi:pimeloyl-ACP methyl ester carboxylesterase